MDTRAKGFTIVELLIVIIVIGILATLVLVAYSGVQEQARIAKAKSDIGQIKDVINIARSNTNKTLAQITGNSVSDQYCVGQPSGTDLATLSRTDRCWTDYINVMTTISQASGQSIANIVDPWGRPYMIDENEGVNGPCYQDTVAMYTHPFVSQWTPDGRTPGENVLLSGATGCTTPTPH